MTTKENNDMESPKAEAEYTHTATLTISSGPEANGPFRLEYTWNPPLAEVLEARGGDDVPAAYQFMVRVLEDSVMPTIALNERYEASLLDEAKEATIN